MRGTSFAAVLTTAAFLVTCGVGVASADEADPEPGTVPEIIDSDIDGNATGGDVAPDDLPKILSQEDADATIQFAVQRVVDGELTKYGAKILLRDFGLPTGNIDSIPENPPNVNSVPTNVTAAAAAPASRTLTITHRPQALNYYCGPATAQMILSNYPTSKWDSAARSQSVLATDTYLQTNTRGATTWASNRMSATLHRWINGNTTSKLQFVTWGKPSGSSYSTAIKTSIGKTGLAAAVGTVERANAPHYNGHPNRLIGHWIAAYGYTASSVSYADPASSIYPGAATRFQYTTSSFAKNWVTAGNGVVWANRLP